MLEATTVAKELICISCWRTFSVSSPDGVSTVACSHCGAEQPLSADSKPHTGHSDNETGAPTLEMELPASLLAEIQAQTALGLSTPDLVNGPATDPDTVTNPDDATGESVDDDLAMSADEAVVSSAAESDALEAEFDLSEAESEFSEAESEFSEAESASDQSDLETASPGSDASEATADDDDAVFGDADQAQDPGEEPVGLEASAVEAGDTGARRPRDVVTEPELQPAAMLAGAIIWRMKLRSGLVLTFPSFDLVVGWVKDKAADDVSIARGDSGFHPYSRFLGALAVAGDAVAALNLLESNESVTALSGDELESNAKSLAEIDDKVETDAQETAAAAAAAAQRRESGRALRQTDYKFRVGGVEPPSNPWLLRIVLFLVLCGMGVLAVLLLGPGE